MLTQRMIEAFRAVVLNGSISEAAEFLNVSQPAVSRLIKDLEAEVGFLLFDRRQGRVFTNDDGLAFYEEVHRAYIGLQRISRYAEQIRNRETGTLRIACLPAIGLSIMPKVIAEFQELYPGVRISFQVVRSTTVLQFLTSMRCDIGIVESSFSAPTIDEGPIFGMDSVCVVPPDHPLSAAAVIRPEDLAGESFISLDADSKTRFKIDAIFDSAKVSRTMLMETPLTSMACSLVLEGCGVSIVDPMTASNFVQQGLVVRPFTPAAEFSFRILNSIQISGTSLVADFYEVFDRIFQKNSMGDTKELHSDNPESTSLDRN